MQSSYLYHMEQGKQWFEDWFDSPYYHILYKHRDTIEAENFLSRLIAQIPLTNCARVLDIACGKGRHSIYLNTRGFDVFGFDLSKRSILHNSTFENETLHFAVHDMRSVIRAGYFDYAINLFSSFGYFESLHDNQRVFNSAAAALKKGGTFIFDYVNINWAIKNALGTAQEINDGITFNIVKQLQGDFIQKTITFCHGGQDFAFKERLRLFTPEQLKAMIEKAGLKITSVYGNYALEPFNHENSTRIVIVSEKK
jgi:SAM-dependent methyltransferase